MILGVDASISSTGFAVIREEDRELIDCGKITTTTKNEEDDRIFTISNQILELCKKYEVTELILEAQYFSKNVKTAMQLSRLRGAITFVAKHLGIVIIHRTPSEVRKNLTGDGSMPKEDVALYVADFYKENNLVIELGEFCDRACKKKNSDIYDAIAIALSEINIK